MASWTITRWNPSITRLLGPAKPLQDWRPSIARLLWPTEPLWDRRPSMEWLLGPDKPLQDGITSIVRLLGPAKPLQDLRPSIVRLLWTAEPLRDGRWYFKWNSPSLVIRPDVSITSRNQWTNISMIDYMNSGYVQGISERNGSFVVLTISPSNTWQVASGYMVPAARNG